MFLYNKYPGKQIGKLNAFLIALDPWRHCSTWDKIFDLLHHLRYWDDTFHLPIVYLTYCSDISKGNRSVIFSKKHYITLLLVGSNLILKNITILKPFVAILFYWEIRFWATSQIAFSKTKLDLHNQDVAPESL